MSMALFCIVFLLACMLLLLSFLRPAKKLKLPPGPSNLPIIGNLHRLGDLPHRSLHKLSQKHGPLMYLKLGSVPTVVASSPAIAKEFLQTHDLDCCSRPPLTPLNKLSYGFSDISFAPYGEHWRELRKISIIHLFSAKKVASFQSIREEEAQAMIDTISCAQTAVNLNEVVSSLANNITCRAAFGKRYYSDNVKTLCWILSETMAMFTAFFFTDYLPMLGWLDWLNGMEARLEKNFRELDGFYERVINEHLDPMIKKNDGEEDMVDALLDMQRKTTNLTGNHVKGLLMDIFLAGSETSATVIEWAMVELMRNPEAMKKAQIEVRSVLGRKRKMVLESDLNQLPYLKSIIKETLRLHPPLPILLYRETMNSCKINGYDIPAKTRLLINVWAIGRDKDIWERPHEFYPERFMNSPVDFRGHDFEFIPFGAGRRICPGMNPGILVVELCLANLLYCFDWSLPEEMVDEVISIEEVPGLTVHKKGAICLVATCVLEDK